jgi:hypothetical protein
MKPTYINNPNSPEKLLAPWLLVNMRRHFEIRNTGTVTLGRWLLAGILSFAEDNNKLIDMYLWIESEEGQQFFQSCDPEGHYVLNALTDIRWAINSKKYKSAKSDLIEQNLLQILEKFIQKNMYAFKYQLTLK